MTQCLTPNSKNSEKLCFDSIRAMTPRLNSSADFQQQKNEIMKL